MANEPIAVQLAILATTMKHIQADLEEARLARKEQYKSMEEQGRVMVQVHNRIEAVEQSLKQQAPTIEEFITIKHKVVGAGVMGKWIWAAVGGILTMLGLVISARAGLLQWIAGK